MIELKKDRLTFSFPEVHPEAKLEIEFQRTLRIPDDGDEYPLPPGLGGFPLCHVDDYADNVPEAWSEHGGVFLPMFQSEAMWINFMERQIANRRSSYPFAIRIATGKTNAIDGRSWTERLTRGPQNYVVAPTQPWLDGYCVKKGVIRQFVAMPLGSGYTAEEQISGEAKYGGVQIAVHPMKGDVFERRFPVGKSRAPVFEDCCYMVAPDSKYESIDMGLAPGGQMRQEVYDDPFDLEDWDLDHSSRCFVHISNSLVWREITGTAPPTVPPTASEYTNAGLPWFDYYSDGPSAIEGTGFLKKLKSIVDIGKEKGDVPLPENKSVNPKSVVVIKKKRAIDQVREGQF